MKNMIKGEKVLIMLIEDDKFLRDLLVHKLETTDFNISTIVDGQGAFEKIKEEMPDIVLLDLVLPGVDGYDILKQIKQDSQTSKIPVIILSNLGQAEEVERGLNLGASDYLIKAHFTPDEIIGKIRAVLGNN